MSSESETYIKRLEDALCGAISIIRNEAGIADISGRNEGASTLRRWADELIAESGIDFDAVLDRVKEPEW